MGQSPICRRERLPAPSVLCTVLTAQGAGAPPPLCYGTSLTLRGTFTVRCGAQVTVSLNLLPWRAACCLGFSRAATPWRVPRQPRKPKGCKRPGSSKRRLRHGASTRSWTKRLFLDSRVCLAEAGTSGGLTTPSRHPVRPDADERGHGGALGEADVSGRRLRVKAREDSVARTQQLMRRRLCRHSSRRPPRRRTGPRADILDRIPVDSICWGKVQSAPVEEDALPMEP